MGYFPNGSAGDKYVAQWCERCVHDDADFGCAVWELHLRSSNSQAERAALDVLIPRTADRLGNERCKMFLERREADGD